MERRKKAGTHKDVYKIIKSALFNEIMSDQIL